MTIAVSDPGTVIVCGDHFDGRANSPGGPIKILVGNGKIAEPARSTSRPPGRLRQRPVTTSTGVSPLCETWAAPTRSGRPRRARRARQRPPPPRPLDQRAPSALDATPALVGEVKLARLRGTERLGELVHECKMVA
jgi:hypothetical protein